MNLVVSKINQVCEIQFSIYSSNKPHVCEHTNKNYSQIIIICIFSHGQISLRFVKSPVVSV